MTFSTAAATGRSDDVVSSWKLDNSSTNTSGHGRVPPSRLVWRKHVEHRVADVAGDHRDEPSRAAQRARERGDRGLAVAAGDREHLLFRRQRAREELDVTDEFRAARHRGREFRSVLRQARADRDQVGTGERRVGERAGGKAARLAAPRGGRQRAVAVLECRRRARALLRARG